MRAGELRGRVVSLVCWGVMRSMGPMIGVYCLLDVLVRLGLLRV
jgi:hypothetical protein